MVFWHQELKPFSHYSLTKISYLAVPLPRDEKKNEEKQKRKKLAILNEKLHSHTVEADALAFQALLRKYNKQRGK